ncbi:MAG: hypothetical protein WA777_18000 [Rhodanobacter sp.]
MKAQLSNITTYTPVLHNDVHTSAYVPAQKVVSFIAAILFTSVSLIALSSGAHRTTPVTEINGTKVINLAPVQVRPSAMELRAAELLTDADIPAAISWASHGAEIDASLLGAQLAMPYYSFGNKFGRISSKE